MILYRFMAILAIMVMATIVIFHGNGWTTPWPIKIHLLLAVGIMPLILTAMIYFTPTLTQTRSPEKKLIAVPILALLAGILLLISWDIDSRNLRALAATMAMMAAGWTGYWLYQRKKATLGSPHPGLRWYQGAVVALLLALLAPWMMIVYPQWGHESRLWHIHLNMLGFLAMAIGGTLPLLLLTTLENHLPQTARHLYQSFTWAAAGSILIAGGATWSWPMVAAIGGILWLYPAMLALYLSLPHMAKKLSWHGAATNLFLAAILFPMVFVLGVLHGYKIITSDQLFIIYFSSLLPILISSAMVHLLPIWLWPSQKPTVWRQQLGKYHTLRGVLWLECGLLQTFSPAPWLSHVLLAIVAWFIGQIFWTIIPSFRR